MKTKYGNISIGSSEAGKGEECSMSNELAVITKAKDLCDYVLTVTDRSPKKFRFTLVIRLQNYKPGR